LGTIGSGQSVSPRSLLLLWLFDRYISSDVEKFFSSGTIVSTFLTALIVFVLTLLARFLIRLLIEPSKLYYQQKERAEVAEGELQRRFTPQIALDYHGVTETPTEILTTPPQRGPSSKWVQFGVSCATSAALFDCEAWLTSVQKIDGNVIGPELVEEHVNCIWSQRSETKITVPPLLNPRANLFSLHEDGHPLQIVPRTNPLKIRLRDAIQDPGSYRVRVLVTAHGAPPFSASFILKWPSFADVTLTQG
jgi:hypothetical protein